MRELFQLTSLIVIGLLSPNAIAWIGADVCEFETSNKLTSSGSESQFGICVAMDGDTALISATNNGQGGSTSIFNKLADGSWSESQQIQPADGQPNSGFGRSIDIDGDSAIIGDPYVDSYGGRAYIFERQSDGTWAETQSFDPPSIACQWGYSVAISGNYALVGGPDFDGFGGNYDYGAVKMYVRQSDGYWEERSGIMPSDLQYQAKFGSSISISGDVAIIGARGDWEDDAASGSAYLIQLFSNGTWEIISKISASDAAGSDRFGTSVAIDGTVAIIGAPENDDSHDNSGSVYIFERQSSGQWLETQKLVAFDATAWSWFGESVALADGIAIIGADRHPGGGCAYTAEQDGDGSWSITSKFVSSGNNESYFGGSAAISGKDGIVGAWGSSGRAYLISLADCDQNNILDSCDLESGTAQDCNSNTIPDECDIANGISDDCNANGVPDSCETDCNSNNIPDECDIANGYSTDCNSNGIPDSCDLDDVTSVDCNGNGVPDECDIANGYSTDCNSNGIPDSCDLDDVTSVDCNGNGVPDECDIANGYSTDCNSNGIPDSCDLDDVTSVDCNGNGVPDECDLADGVSTDCNGNTVPDTCDIANGTSTDCNGNGIPDSCDVADGTSSDCNLNGISDTCDIANGTSTDCNGNGVPDPCDIANGTSTDCNLNGLSDSCDILNGASQDLDNNGIPDECTIPCPNYVISEYQSSDGAQNDSFGESVAISGDIAIIGSASDDDNGSSSGSVYLFEKQATGAWLETGKLLASDGASGDAFGSSVAISGSTVIVGAYGDDDNGSTSGSVYIFEQQQNGSWIQQAKLTASDGGQNQRFGFPVAISGEFAAIGAHRDSYNGDTSGSAYIFKRNMDGSWSQVQKITAADAAAYDYFGYSLAISGNTILVGAHRDDDNGSSSGSVYVFEQQEDLTWLETDKLLALDGSAGDQFGIGLSISVDIALIGAPLDQDNGGDSGSVYVFSKQDDNWTQTEKLLATDGNIGDQFGHITAIQGDRALIGAEFDRDNGARSGSAYMFERQDDDTWRETAKFTDLNGQEEDQFGNSVALSPNTALIGCPELDRESVDQGGFYVIQISDGYGISDCNLNGACDINDIAFGYSQDCDSNGLLDECESFTDCNLNGVWDLCDINNGTSLDNDGDGIPDECFCGDLTQTLDYTDLIFTSSGDDVAIDDSYAVTMSVNQNASGGWQTYVEIFKNQYGQWSHEHTHLPVSRTDTIQYFPNKRISIDDKQIIFIEDGGGGFGDSVIEILSKVDGEWLITAELISDNGSLPALSVDISGDVAVIGHAAQDVSEGRVLVYRRYGNSWVKETELAQSLGEPVGWFGADVAVDGNTIMVCSLGDGPWIYEFNGQNWVETQFVQLQDINTGSTIDLDGDLCVVGSNHQYSTGCSVLRRVDGQWELEQRLTSEDSTTEGLGYAVRISGNTILASSGLNYGTDPPGKAHVFQHDGSSWMETRIYEEPKISDDPWLSSPRIALSGNHVALGFIDESPFGFTSLDIHTLSSSTSDDNDCNQNGICDSLDIASGTSEDCDGNGVPDSCDIVDGIMDVDLDGILDLCEQDCDGDQWPDDYEIEQGLELDCNANGVPDSCDIINGLSPDVDEDGIPDECGEGYIIQVSNSDETPFMSIQAALDFSIPGSTILIQAGIYNGSMVFPDHPVHLISESGAQDTIIQGLPGSSVLVITGNNHNGTLVQGFTITGGLTSNGGGVLIANGCPTIVDCIFEENVATQSGGGAYIVNAAPLFLDCEFIGNIGPYGGGGMCVQGHYPGETPVQLADCLFLENKVNGLVEGGIGQPGGGGLITYRARIDINGCRFDLNEATSESSSSRFGGGIDAREVTMMRIDDSSFSYNTSGFFGKSISLWNNRIDVPYIEGKLELSNTTSCLPGSNQHIAYPYEDLGGNQFANDCNEDGICGFSDCNGNDAIDECDIEDGSSSDVNNDGIPDECVPTCDSFLMTNTLAEDGVAGDYFGISVAISEKTALIGASGDSTGSSVNGGSAYIFEQQTDGTWIEAGKLIPSDLSSYDRFGWRVDISNQTALIGADRDDDYGSSSGSAYIFQRQPNGQWLESIKLVPSDLKEGDGFGSSVSISGSIAVVGAPFDDDSSDSSGSAYAFVRSDDGNWIESAKLTASDADNNDYFGLSVAIMGTTAMIGAWGDDENAEDAGSVYIFEQQTDGSWIETAKLMASNGSPGDYFGCSIAMSENTAIVGAYQDESAASGGTAYIFEKQTNSTWLETSILNSADGTNDDRFGLSVDISSGTAIVGAYRDDDFGVSSGSAYIFKRMEDGSWMETEKLTDLSGEASDYFGYSVAISENLAVIGSVEDNTNGNDAGSGFIFGVPADLNVSDCNDNGLCDELDMLSGISQDCDGNESLDACDIANGIYADVDLDGIPDVCEADCDGDLIPDDYEIADGTEIDCNGNGVPDGCDVTAGSSPDENEDGIPDECDSGYVITVANDSTGFFSQIQPAIDLALPGATIQVSPGVYNGSLVFPSHAIRLVSESGPETTIISATSNQSVVYIGEGHSDNTLLEGFTLTGGVTSLGGGVQIVESSPTIRNCVLLANEAQKGGGALVIRGAPLFDECKFLGNSALRGGGINVRDADLAGDSVRLIGCLIQDNLATGSSTSEGSGGGLACEEAFIVLTSTTIHGNESSFTGGGLVANNSTVLIGICQFLSNVSTLSGGAATSLSTTLSIVSTTFCGNEPNDILGSWDDLGGNIFDDDIEVCTLDCNVNGFPDFIDIAFGNSEDENGNGIPDECECPDTNDDGFVDVNDILFVIDAWGDCGPDADCPADVDGDGLVNVNDLLLIISEWGACQ